MAEEKVISTLKVKSSENSFTDYSIGAKAENIKIEEGEEEKSLTDYLGKFITNENIVNDFDKNDSKYGDSQICGAEGARKILVNLENKISSESSLCQEEIRKAKSSLEIKMETDYVQKNSEARLIGVYFGNDANKNHIHSNNGNLAFSYRDGDNTSTVTMNQLMNAIGNFSADIGRETDFKGGCKQISSWAATKQNGFYWATGWKQAPIVCEDCPSESGYFGIVLAQSPDYVTQIVYGYERNHKMYIRHFRKKNDGSEEPYWTDWATLPSEMSLSGTTLNITL